jgi:hypothetical protein
MERAAAAKAALQTGDEGEGANQDLDVPGNEPDPADDPAAQQQQPPPDPNEPDPNAPPEGEAKPDRMNSYKRVVAERDEAQAGLEKVNADLAKYGGTDGFNHIASVFDAFLDPTGKFTVTEPGADGAAPVERELTGSEMINNFVEQLPESDKIFSDFFLKGLDSIENRVFAVNDVMKQEFGLKPEGNITADQFNTMLEYIAAKVNLAKTPAEVEKVFKDLEFETKGLDYNAEEFTKDREIAELKAKLAAKDNPEAQPADPVAEMEKSYQKALESEQGRITAEETLLVERYQEVGAETLASYGLAPNDKDSPEMAEAKQLLNDLLLGKQNIASVIRPSKAFKMAAGFLHKNTLKAPAGTIANGNLTTAMSLRLDNLLEKLSPLIAGVKAPARKPGQPGANGNGNRQNIDAGGGNPGGEKKGFMDRARDATGRQIKEF